MFFPLIKILQLYGIYETLVDLTLFDFCQYNMCRRLK